MALAAPRMTYVPEYRAEGHDPGCGAHYMEACDCAQGIVRAVAIAFAADLKRATSRAAQPETEE